MKTPKATAVGPKPLDLSGCQDVGGWHVCPHLAPSVLLSSEQLEALKKTRALTNEDIEGAAKALKRRK